MFLESTMVRNKKLVEVSFDLFREGRIEPNTYIIDLDSVLRNAENMKKKADSCGIKLYFMTKQFGRNPYIAKKLIELGYEGAVVVDFEEAELMMKNNIPIGNIGHLGQIPSNLIKKVVSYGVEYITLYSIEKLREINEAAKELNKKQKVMLRVVGYNDIIYSGQKGGVCKEDIKNIIEELKLHENIELAGLTSFPCFLFNEEEKKIKATTNVETIKEFKGEFEKNNVNIMELSMPSVTCIENLNLIKSLGGTQGEPGHSLTGTTPNIDKEEIPSIVYGSEISHNFREKSYCFGGGYYRRGHLEKALVGKNMESAKLVTVVAPSPESIDYYIEIDEECNVGDIAIMAFRTQVFVTRSKVAIVEGLSKGKPVISSIYNSLGELIREC